MKSFVKDSKRNQKFAAGNGYVVVPDEADVSIFQLEFVSMFDFYFGCRK
jgi:hypothetical protein